MISADYHVHSNFSSDGKATMEQMIGQAIHLGLKRLCFTDHMDYDYPQISSYTFQLDTDAYTGAIAELKDKYSRIIDIFMGIELGLQPHLGQRLTKLTESIPFDFIIGSSHVVDNIDPYCPEYWEGITEEEGIHRYFETIINNCRAFHGFHVYGHIDYIIRYVPRILAWRKNNMNKTNNTPGSGMVNIPADLMEEIYPYHKYSDILDEALKAILYYGKGIELNTSCLARGFSSPHPRPEILQRFRELGGELVTLGSDSHVPETMCYSFDYAAALLQSLGFRYYTVFEQGKPVMLPLDR